VRVPDEARLGKVKIKYSFDVWREGQAASTTIEIPIFDSAPVSPVRALLRSIPAVLLPATVAWWEAGEVPIAGAAMFALLMACWTGVVARRVRHARCRPIPASMLGALAISAFFLVVFALEISAALAVVALEVGAGLAGQGGLVTHSLFYFLPGLLLFWGLFTSRRWAHHLMRWGSLTFALLFVGVAALACVLQPLDPHGPVWIWTACGSYVLASLLVVWGFYALGRASATRYFMVQPG
jgi:hypothetical protein